MLYRGLLYYCTRYSSSGKAADVFVQYNSDISDSVMSDNRIYRINFSVYHKQ